MESIREINGFTMPVPNHMNHIPPPQIFGAYATDGSVLGANLSDLAGQMFGDPTTLLDDSNEAKRRRIARVCCPDSHLQNKTSDIDFNRPVICAGRRR